MSYSTSQFHTGTTTEIQSANAAGGARTGISTDDQTYNLHVSDGVRWRNIQPARLYGIQYTYNNTTIVPETPIYHLDASDLNSMKNSDGNTPAHEDTVAEWSSLTCGHKLTQQTATSQPVFRNDNGGSVVFPELEFLQTEISKSQRLSGEFTIMTVRRSWVVANDLYRIHNGLSSGTPGGYYGADTYGNNIRTVCSSVYEMEHDGDHNFNQILVGDQQYNQYSHMWMNGDGTSGRSFRIHTFPLYSHNVPSVGPNGETVFDWYNNEYIDKTQIEFRTYSERMNSFRSVTYWQPTPSTNGYYAEVYKTTSSQLLNPGHTQTSHLHGLRVGANGLNFSRQSINEIMIFNTCLKTKTLDMLATSAANKWSVSNTLNITR